MFLSLWPPRSEMRAAFSAVVAAASSGVRLPHAAVGRARLVCSEAAGVADSLSLIRSKVKEAAVAAGRAEDAARLVAVSKTKPVEMLRIFKVAQEHDRTATEPNDEDTHALAGTAPASYHLTDL